MIKLNNPKDLELVQKIYRSFRELESTAKDGNFPLEGLNKLIVLLGEAEFSQEPAVNKLVEIRDHLYPCMSLKHFTNFLIPIERLIDRSVKDDDFLVTTTDVATKPAKQRDLYFVLDNLRSAFNVGSIFRLADGLGVKKIYLCGYTATPAQEQLKKTAMGAHDLVSWEHFESTQEALKSLRKDGVFIIALETAGKSIPLSQSPLTGPTAFLVGNERFGLDNTSLGLVDEVRHIPMFGVKNSLNVANSLSIAAYEWSRQN